MAIKINLYNSKAESVGNLDLSEKIFGVEVNNDLVHQAMVAQMGNERQVLAHTKTKSEVRGGGKKPWRQKGTGRARSGSSRSPLWIGGGITFGPRKDRNFKKNINQKMKQKALFMVLSDKVKTNGLVVLDSLEVKEFKTKAINTLVKNLETKVWQNPRRSVLMINDDKSEALKYSTRNLADVEIINLENINILDLLHYRNLVLSQAGLKKLEQTYLK
ncbi:MAG TPA: 50S ribosomal protein L4 [bacterium]|nr:50S ribosomal protein L4 [bacterium]HPT29937.1 50S ribosomal protein L4 [bacterium]